MAGDAPRNSRWRNAEATAVDDPRPASQFQKAAERRVLAKQQRQQQQAANEAANSAPAAAEQEREQDGERLARSVFVGNVPVTTDRQALKRHFSAFGKVESVRIRSAASANLKMSQRAAVITGTIASDVRDSVNAYIVYADPAEAQAAIAGANGAVAFGRHLRVDGATPRGESASAGVHRPKRAVFVGSLPWDTQEEELWELFARCGVVEYVRIIRDAQTQKGKGFGYVGFKEKRSVEDALLLNNTTLKERSIRVFRCANSNNRKRVRARGAKQADRVQAPAAKRFKPSAATKMKRAKKDRQQAKQTRKDSRARKRLAK